MKKIFVLCCGILLIMTSLVLADEIYLKSGQLIEGNILKVNKFTNTLDINVVMDGELVGCTITLRPDEIKSISLNDNYRDLKRKEISEEEKEKYRQETIERIKTAREFEYNSRKEYLNYIEKQNKKEIARLVVIEEREKLYKRQKFFINLYHENTKDLIYYAGQRLNKPYIRIEPSRQLLPKEPTINIKRSGKASSGSTENLLLMMGQ